MNKVKLKSENNNDKINTQNRIKMEVVNKKKLNKTSFSQKQRYEKGAITVVQERVCYIIVRS